MDSDKVHLTDSAESELEALNPNDRQTVVGVLKRLEINRYRHNEKYDLYYNQDEYGGDPVWGLEAGSVFVAFVEESDGAITVVHLSLRSRFRPGLRRRW